MERYEKDGQVLPREMIRLRSGDGRQVINPTHDMLLASGWRLVAAAAEESVSAAAPPYEVLVEGLIRERYSVSDELALLRQRDAKAEEFAAYYAYCEDCKRRARGETALA